MQISFYRDINWMVQYFDLNRNIYVFSVRFRDRHELPSSHEAGGGV